MTKKLLTIGEAAGFLDISIDTLRRWDSSGKLKAYRSPGGHRYYSLEQLEHFKMDMFALARIWAESVKAPELLPEYYCETQDIFRARLDSMAVSLDNSTSHKAMASLITAVTGEVGNNSFDHNLGNWPDVPGIFYAYDLNKRLIVLADRGLGIRTTLLRVRPQLKDDIAALRTAFTERISGRSPEQRGNGLKFVYNTAVKYDLGILLQSGTAVADIQKSHGKLIIGLADRFIRGTLAKIIF